MKLVWTKGYNSSYCAEHGDCKFVIEENSYDYSIYDDSTFVGEANTLKDAKWFCSRLASLYDQLKRRNEA